MTNYFQLYRKDSPLEECTQCDYTAGVRWLIWINTRRNGWEPFCYAPTFAQALAWCQGLDRSKVSIVGTWKDAPF